MHRGIAAAGVGAEEYGAEQSHRYLREINRGDLYRLSWGAFVAATNAAMASRSPRRFRDGAAKFGFGTVIRGARGRAVKRAGVLVLVLMQAGPLVARPMLMVS